jgi:hypothetical protein
MLKHFYWRWTRAVIENELKHTMQIDSIKMLCSTAIEKGL